MFKPFDIEFGPFIDEMNAKERAIRECADGATMDRIRSKDRVRDSTVRVEFRLTK